MRNLLYLGLSLAALSACQTMTGLQRDVTSMMGGAAQTQTVRTASCPQVRVMPELDMLAEFSDDANPSAKREISTARITDVKSGCVIGTETSDLTIEIAFTSTLGPKAKIKNDDKPNFAYPYFVAVTNNDGQILAKEIFAASIAFDAKQTEKSQIEIIQQQLPVRQDIQPQDYNVLIGFQLTEDQLSWNRTQKSTPTQ